MQRGRVKLQDHLYGGLMETSRRGIVVWACLISITLHSPEAAFANEANHKVMAYQTCLYAAECMPIIAIAGEPLSGADCSYNAPGAKHLTSG